jgi:hypothetical protein
MYDTKIKSAEDPEFPRSPDQKTGISVVTGAQVYVQGLYCDKG